MTFVKIKRGLVETVFKWLDFKITNRCNNKCLYCGVNQDSPAEEERIQLSQTIDALEDAIDLDFTHFALLGGEPSIRADIEELLTPFSNTKSVHTLMIISNMLIFNEPMYRALFGTRCKNATLVASIDNLSTPNFKNQDSKKVLSFIEKVLSIADEYKALGNRGVHIHSVISRENYQNLLDLVSFFNGKGLEVSLAIVEPFQLVTNPRNYNQFSKLDIELIISELNHLEEAGNLSFANGVLRDYLERFVLGEYDTYKSCTAGIEHVIIDSDGSVYPCLTEAYRQGITFGNIKNDRFKDLYEQMKGFHCKSPFLQTCWDHYLWTRLVADYGGK